MPSLTPISHKRHADKRWLRISSYAFAAKDAVAVLVAAELPKAIMAMPVGFVAQGEGYAPAAVMGLAPGQNLLVAPDGRWLAHYIPAALRGHPFQLANTEDGRQVLCIDEDCGLLTDGPNGEAFFDDEGQPAKAVADLLNFLIQVRANHQATQRICAALQKHGLIQPWAITVKGDAGERRVEGLCRIDETALNALPAEAFLELREAGALTVAYCQLLSMQHLPSLGRLATARAHAAQPAPKPAGDLDLEFLNQGGTISFGNLH